MELACRPMVKAVVVVVVVVVDDDDDDDDDDRDKTNNCKSSNTFDIDSIELFIVIFF